MLNLTRVFQYLATCRWFRHIKANARFAIGGYAYAVGTPLRGRTLELRFDPVQAVFIGQPEGSDAAITMAPQGLTKADLMGELGDLLALPAYQLALPFTYHVWRHLAYARTLAAAPAAATGALA